MSVYLFMVLGLLALWAVFKKLDAAAFLSSQNAQKGYLICAVLLLSFVEGLRASSVGTDTVAYFEIFTGIQSGSRFEIGFKMLVAALHVFTDSPTALLLALALLTNACVAAASYKISSNPYMSMLLWVLLYYYFMAFNLTRQYVSVGFLLLAFAYASDKKWIFYAIFQLLAIAFHNTAFAGLLLLFLFAPLPVCTSRIKNGIMIVTAALVAVFWKPLLAFAASILPEYYAGYITGGNFLIARTGGFRQTVIYGAIFLAFLLFTAPQSEARQKYTSPMLLVVLFSVFVMRALIFERFLYYFEAWSIFVIPEICSSDYRIKDVRVRAVLQTGILAVCGLLMLYLLSANYMHVVPYLSIFSE